MTEVYFYILESDRADAVMHFACRLTEKAYHAGHRIFIHVTSEAQVATMDRLLWQFRQGSFVPHETDNELTQGDDLCPVIIGCRAPPVAFDDFLVNIEGDTSAFHARFARCNEIVGPHALGLARQKYRHYKDQGYALTTHHIGNQ